MGLSPRRARLALGVFVAVGGIIAGNILLLQGDAPTRAAQRAKAERAQERADKDRQRRLALKSSETPVLPAALAPRGAPASPQPPAAPARPSAAAEPTPAQIERIGRFAPSASQIGAARIPESDAEARALEVVRAVQKGLAERGYEPGTPDGVVGLVTRAAVMAYEHDHGLPLTAEPSEVVMRHMQTGLAPPAEPGAQRIARAGRMPHAEQLIRHVQHTLASLGYFAGRIDGFAGDDTVRAMREYEMDAGLVPTGRVSAPLVARLTRQAQARSAR